MLNILSNIASETLIPLAELRKSKLIPKSRRGERVALTTIHRWARRGCHGVQLEVIKCGATFCSSEEALLRFFRDVTEAASRQNDVDIAAAAELSISRASRGQPTSTAAAELDAIGI